MRAKKLTHFDEAGNARMVDVGAKDVTERVAVARASITMNFSISSREKASSFASVALRVSPGIYSITK